MWGLLLLGPCSASRFRGRIHFGPDPDPRIKAFQQGVRRLVVAKHRVGDDEDRPWKATLQKAPCAAKVVALRSFGGCGGAAWDAGGDAKLRGLVSGCFSVIY